MPIRTATPEDVPALIKLANSAYRGEESKQGWTTEAHLISGNVRIEAPEVFGLITAPGKLILVLETNAEIVGCVHLANQGSAAYLGLFSVKPSAQNGGLGRQLLAAAEAWAKNEWHCSRIEMNVITHRRELLDWYLRRGYRDTGRRSPFPYDNKSVGTPQRADLEFLVLEKVL